MQLEGLGECCNFPQWAAKAILIFLRIGNVSGGNDFVSFRVVKMAGDQTSAVKVERRH